jgi:carboxypeptidase PM20D1
MLSALFIILAILSCFVVYIIIKTLSFKTRQVSCSLIDPIEIPLSAISNLSEAIKIKTVSKEVNEDIDSAEFLKFHQFLNETYPQANSILEKLIFNKYSIVMKWQGDNPELKPVILIAHFDVVPVEKSELEKWDHPPFSGVIDNDVIWGRGALDNKMNLISIMEAIEHLISNQFYPSRTVYVVSGHDEEVYGPTGAQYISNWFKEQGITAEFILDEGSFITQGMIPGISKNAAMIGISEKQPVYVELTTEQDPMHLSMPPKETSIDIIAQALIKLNKQQMAPEISEPIEAFFMHLGPEMPFIQKLFIANRAIFKSLVVSSYTKTDAGNALVRNSISPFHFNTGDAIIGHTAVKATVFCKLLPGNTIEDIVDYIKTTIDDDRIKVTVNYDKPTLTTYVSDPSSFGYSVLNKSIKQVFPNTLTAPGLVSATTDSRYFSEISNNIFRFSPFLITANTTKTIHGINERIEAKELVNGIRFYIQLIKNVNE